MSPFLPFLGGGTLTPKTKLDAPAVAVSKRSATLTLQPEKDLGTAWTCEGPTIFYKGKVIKKKAANALLKKQIDALGSGARAKIRKTALKATKKAINRCGGA